MMNFLFGTAAGGIVACILTITAARHPEVQARLGLVPPVLAAAPAPRCPTPQHAAAAGGAMDGMAAASTATGMGIGRPDLLFSRKRFWNVAP